MTKPIGKLRNSLFITGNREPTTIQRVRRINGKFAVRYIQTYKMTIYKRSEFLFKKQEQLLLTKDLGSYGNLDTGD